MKTITRQHRPSADPLVELIERLGVRVDESLERSRADSSARIEQLLERVVDLLGQRPQTAVEPRLLGRAAAAAYLGVSIRQVDHLRSTGKLPAVIVEHRPLYDRRDLDHFIDENRETAR